MFFSHYGFKLQCKEFSRDAFALSGRTGASLEKRNTSEGAGIIFPIRKGPGKIQCGSKRFLIVSLLAALLPKAPNQTWTCWMFDELMLWGGSQSCPDFPTCGQANSLFTFLACLWMFMELNLQLCITTLHLSHGFSTSCSHSLDRLPCIATPFRHQFEHRSIAVMRQTSRALNIEAWNEAKPDFTHIEEDSRLGCVNVAFSVSSWPRGC